MRPRTSITAAAIAVVAILVAGCGGSSPGSTVANVGSGSGKTSTGTAASDPGGGSGDFFSKALKFSQCMRAHGVPDFPDPKQSSHGSSLTLRVQRGGDLNPRSAQFMAAQRACRAYAPTPPTNAAPNPQLQQQALAFAQCMRSHGVPNFPDPKVSGNSLQLGGPSATGFNPNSPQFQAAQKACQSKLPGAGSKTGGAAGGGSVQ